MDNSTVVTNNKYDRQQRGENLPPSTHLLNPGQNLSISGVESLQRLNPLSSGNSAQCVYYSWLEAKWCEQLLGHAAITEMVGAEILVIPELVHLKETEMRSDNSELN